MPSASINLEANMLSRSKINAHAILGSMLFVAIIVNTSIGYLNEYALGNALGNIGQFFFWFVLGLSVIITVTFRERYIFFVLLLIGSLLVSRFMSTLSLGALVVYRLIYSLLIAFASAVFYLKSRKVYELWLKTFIVINLILLILQVLGVSDLVHMWNTLFVGPDNVLRVELAPTLFVGIDDLNVQYQQLRSPGLFYSNAVTAGFLIMAIGHRIGGNSRKFTLYDAVLIASVFLLMAKISVVFLIVAAVIRYLSCDANEKAVRRKYLLAIPCVSFLYYIFFFGVFQASLNMNKFLVSAGIRVADILISQGIEEMPIIGGDIQSQAAQILSMNYADESDVGGLSGIKMIGILLPLILFVLIVEKKLLKHSLIPSTDNTRAKYLMFGFLFCFLATPILGATLTPFMLGPALIVFLNSYNIRRLIIRQGKAIDAL